MEQADGHHHEIGRHLVFADEGAKGVEHFGNLVGTSRDEIVVVAVLFARKREVGQEQGQRARLGKHE